MAVRKFILDSDWWTDCDDAVAVRLLCNAHRRKEVDLLGINLNACMEFSIPSLDVFTRDAGINVPLGLSHNSVDFFGDPPYQKHLAQSAPVQRKNQDVPESIDFYRQILTRADDDSVEIISIGFTQELAKLLPDSGTVSVNYPAEFATRAAAYDLVKHCGIPLKKQAGKISFKRDLAPADGSLVMVLKEPIKSVQLDMPEKLRLKDKFQLKVQLLDAAGNPIKAILPLEITLIDSNGKHLPGSGFYAAVNGQLIVDEVVAPNTSKGTVDAAVKCLSSGKTAAAQVIIY